jgi:hypothetical protein
MSDGAVCLHCVINRAMDHYSERSHLETGNPVNVDDSIGHLMECAAELIAMYDDAKLRKFVAKRTCDILTSLVRKKRSEGCYPGGPGQTPIRSTEH